MKHSENNPHFWHQWACTQMPNTTEIFHPHPYGRVVIASAESYKAAAMICDALNQTGKAKTEAALQGEKDEHT